MKTRQLFRSVSRHSLRTCGGEVKDIKDKATAMEAYAYQARDPDLASYSVEVKKRAVRRLGELMEEGPKAKGGGDQRSKHRGIKNPGAPKSLKEQKIDKNLAKAARKEAKLSEDQFERSVEDDAKKIAVAAASGAPDV
jgi:hypothetical protein